MTPLQTRFVIGAAVNGFVMTVLFVLGFVGYLYGACLEPYVAGYVLQIPKADQIYRGYVTKLESGREVEVACWRFHGLHKLAAAIPIKYAFEVEARFSERIPVSAYLSDGRHFQSEADFITHPINSVWDRNYCFEMPGTIADNQTIRVSGHAEHDRLVFGRRWPFWRSITPVPEFIVRPLKCYRDDGSVDASALCSASP